MADPTTIVERIQQDAVDGIQTVSAGGTSVGSKSVSELIEADRYAKGEAAKSSPGSGFRVQYTTPRRGGFR